MVKTIETKSLKEETREKAGEVFSILKENGLFTKEFSEGFKVLNRMDVALFHWGRDLEEHQETLWHIKKGEWRWWNAVVNSAVVMVITLSTNTITFLVLSRSTLLSDIKNLAEQIEARSDFKVKIVIP